MLHLAQAIILVNLSPFGEPKLIERPNAFSNGQVAAMLTAAYVTRYNSLGSE